MLRTLILVAGLSIVFCGATQAGNPAVRQRQTSQSRSIYQSGHETWLQSVIGRPAVANPRPMQRTIGLPTGRAYYGNRYYGNFNNRYFGPQYGYF